MHTENYLKKQQKQAPYYVQKLVDDVKGIVEYSPKQLLKIES